MAITYNRIIVLILAAVLITACSQATTPTPLSPTIEAPRIVSETPTSLPAASPSPEPTDGGKDMPTTQPASGETQIRVIIGDTVLTGRLWDNAPARDLIAQLPLTLTFSDYHGQEKLAPLPRGLSIDGVPAGDDPLPGDIGYYEPAGVLVFYYTDVGYFNGIVRIGQFDGNMEAISGQTGDFTVRIELTN